MRPSLATLATVIVLSCAGCATTVTGTASPAPGVGVAAPAPGTDGTAGGTDDVADPKAEECGTADFDFAPPSGWIDITDDVPATLGLVVAYQDSGGGPPFANVNVTCEDLSGSSLAAYINDNIDELEDLFGPITEGGTVQLAGESAQSWTLTYPYGPDELFLTQVIASRNDVAYIISLTVPTDRQDESPGFLEMITGSWDWT